ncbi:MAG: inositol monophosphatase [Gammaproteobacteria bacterium]|nr:inositol monophosphatase [Gammaproteobacteria bacterium]
MNDDLKKIISIITCHAEQEIMSRFNRVGFDLKRDGSLVTEADLAMQESVARELKTHWPDFDFLGEEMLSENQQALLDADNKGLWILDPLDGTSNFASGVPIFSVSLALVRNKQIQLGCVFDPVRNEMFSAINGQGAWLNGKALHVETKSRTINQCIAQVDFKRLPEKMATRLAAEHPYASQRNFGSGALDWCWLAASRSQFYVHGGQKLWDHAAGHLILLEAGGCACDFSKQEDFSLSLKPQSVVAATNRHQLEQFINAYL